MLSKLIEKIDTEQISIKNKYYQKHIISDETFSRIKTFTGFIEVNKLVSVNKYLSLSDSIIRSIFGMEKIIK